uniref:nuclear transport factor 2 family protein n=1 Tax=Labilibaculum sp. TaxID=2060723 RepID=UPI0035635A3C
MKKNVLVAFILLLFMGTNFTSFAQDSMVKGTGMTVDKIVAEKLKEERNKQNVLEFFQLLMGDHDYEAAEKYMGEYIQHDTRVVGNGMPPLKELLTTSPQFKNRPKGIKFKPAYILADGDFVYMQNRKKLPGKKVLIQHTF